MDRLVRRWTSPLWAPNRTAREKAKDVAWHVDRYDLWSGFKNQLPALIFGTLSFGIALVPVLRQRMVVLMGEGGGLPGWAPTAVRIYPDKATITPGIKEIILPLRDLRIAGAECLASPSSPEYHVDTLWRLELEGEGIAWTMEGPWLKLARLGTLGDWPEPHSTPPPPTPRSTPWPNLPADT